MEKRILSESTELLGYCWCRVEHINSWKYLTQRVGNFLLVYCAKEQYRRDIAENKNTSDARITADADGNTIFFVTESGIRHRPIPVTSLPEADEND